MKYKLSLLFFGRTHSRMQMLQSTFSYTNITEHVLVCKCYGTHSRIQILQNIFFYGRRDPSRSPRGTLYPQKFALTSPTSGVRSVGIVRSRTQATEFVFVLFFSAYKCYRTHSRIQILQSTFSACRCYRTQSRKTTEAAEISFLSR
jgi:hypothetical protein